MIDSKPQRVVETPPTAAAIRATRDECGLTQEEAAAVIGAGRSTWASYETGEAHMHPIIWQAWRIRVGLDDPAAIRVRFLPDLQPRSAEA